VERVHVIKQICRLSFVGLLALSSVGFAQYTLELTGVAPDSASADGVYVSPYQGTISQGSTQIYSGYMICDDFTDESFLGQPWSATETNAGALNGTELFSTSLSGYSVANNYNAVAWLANQLLLPANLNNSTNQTNISFAIWDIMDGASALPLTSSTDPDGGAGSWITQAFTEAVTDHYVGSNVSVYTPTPHGVSQEFLVVTTPEASAPVLLAVDLLGFMALVGFLRKRISQKI
jgi:hypothetical protein